VTVTIAGNEPGFDAEQACTSRGKGLRNQQRRAEAIDGTSCWNPLQAAPG